MKSGDLIIVRSNYWCSFNVKMMHTDVYTDDEPGRYAIKHDLFGVVIDAVDDYGKECSLTHAVVSNGYIRVLVNGHIIRVDGAAVTELA